MSLFMSRIVRYMCEHRVLSVFAVISVFILYLPLLLINQLKRKEEVNTMRTRIKSEDGFTFIEIVGVLVIMSVLAAVTINRFVDLQGRTRGKAIYAAVAELKTRVNGHFCTNLLDGYDAKSITYPADKVDIHLGDDFLVDNWDWETDPKVITLDLTYYPNAQDHTRYPLTKTGLVLIKPLFE